MIHRPPRHWDLKNEVIRVSLLQKYWSVTPHDKNPCALFSAAVRTRIIAIKLPEFCIDVTVHCNFLSAFSESCRVHSKPSRALCEASNLASIVKGTLRRLTANVTLLDSVSLKDKAR